MILDQEVALLKRKHTQMEQELETLDLLRTRGITQSLYQQTQQVVRLAESQAIEARNLPYLIGGTIGKTRSDIRQDMASACTVVQIEKIQTWYRIELPRIQPKNQERSTRYLRELVEYALQKKAPYDMITDKALLLYQHIYNEQSTRPGIRDYDNLETAKITNVLCQYFLQDDAMRYMNEFQISTAGTEDKTIVYLGRYKDAKRMMETHNLFS